MDSRGSQIGVVRPTRRSTRLKKVNELTPREPLKRSRREAENQISVTAVNGYKEDASEDEESPSKKSKRGGAVDGGGDGVEMDVQETEEDLEMNEDQEVMAEEDSQKSTQQRLFSKPLIGDMNLPTTVGMNSLEITDPGMLRSRRPIHTDRDTEVKRGRVEPSSKAPVASTKSATLLRPGDFTSSSMAEYREKMEAKAKSTGNLRANQSGTTCYPKPKGSYKNISAQKQTVQPINQGLNKSAVTKGSFGSYSIGAKRSVTKGSSGSSYKGCIIRFVLVLVVAALGFLAYPYYSGFLGPAGGGGHPSRSVTPGEFVARLSVLETQFPSQRPELWRRSRIHLERHLQKAHPTEPVSLILTAGRRAERTLHCLAQRLASSFSTALNASVLHIDGASKAEQDSDKVKLDIDSQLREAFEGDNPVAVIHRFEELPPGSTLIFYRYCDHENAAYKKTSLIFTVLLGGEEELPAQLDLKVVEEMVDDHLQRKFLSTGHPTAFDRMDRDKYSGLWSRISHLILPVAAEERIEHQGCLETPRD